MSTMMARGYPRRTARVSPATDRNGAEATDRLPSGGRWPATLEQRSQLAWLIDLASRHEPASLGVVCLPTGEIISLELWFTEILEGFAHVPVGERAPAGLWRRLDRFRRAVEQSPISWSAAETENDFPWAFFAQGAIPAATEPGQPRLALV